MSAGFNKDKHGDQYGSSSRPAVSSLDNSPDLPVHYLHNAPSPVFGIVALALALTMLAFGIAEIRNAPPKQTSLAVTTAGTPLPDNVPVLKVTADAWAINDQPIQESDLLFRLSAQAAKSQAIIIQHPAALPASRLTQALETINRAGFAQVGLKAE